MKHLLISVFTLSFFLDCESQVLKVPIIEHFTNSNCSICAANNSTVYNALDNNPSALHISFFPSSPYSSCFFSMQNPVDNDARTNFYGLYGSTPKLTVNGIQTSLSATNMTLHNLATETSAFMMEIKQTFITTDSVTVQLKIKKESTDTTSYASLFIASVEDSVFKLTSNGESIHHDVFRENMTPMIGTIILLPASIGDSILLNYSYKISPNWDANRMNTIAILQQIISKNLIQSAKSTNQIAIPTTVNTYSLNPPKIYPNPASKNIYIETNQEIQRVQLYNLHGEEIQDIKLDHNNIDIYSLPSGFYFIRIKQNNQFYSFHQIINHAN